MATSTDTKSKTSASYTETAIEIGTKIDLDSRLELARVFRQLMTQMGNSPAHLKIATMIPEWDPCDPAEETFDDWMEDLASRIIYATDEQLSANWRTIRKVYQELEGPPEEFGSWAGNIGGGIYSLWEIGSQANTSLCFQQGFVREFLGDLVPTQIQQVFKLAVGFTNSPQSMVKKFNDLSKKYAERDYLKRALGAQAVID